MSDILIKGMNMPENCFACPCCNPYPGIGFDEEEYYCGALNGLPGIISPSSGRLPKCPIVEVPTPHGRLIDADELKKDRINLYGTTDVVLMVDIENAPTIIEAEVSEE